MFFIYKELNRQLKREKTKKNRQSKIDLSVLIWKSEITP